MKEHSNYKISSTFLLLLFTCYILCAAASPANAQTLKSEEVQLEVENLELQTSSKSSDSPQPSRQFLKEGYTIQTLPIDKKVSRAFTAIPRAILLRARPGTELPLRLSLHNHRDAVVITTQIDCSTVIVDSCSALPWFNLPRDTKKFFIEAGSQKKISLTLRIPESAQTGDQYIKLYYKQFNKPYHYTSTAIYLTITNDGKIQQNISVDLQDSKTILDSSTTQNISLHVRNGSPYFALFAPSATLTSPLGFENSLEFNPQVIPGSTGKQLPLTIKNPPLGPATLKLQDKTLTYLFLPNPELLKAAALILLSSLIILYQLKKIYK